MPLKRNRLISAADMPPVPVSLDSMGWNLTGDWRFFDPIHENHLPPCNHTCPAGENVQKCITLVAQQRFREAYDTIRESNPLPATCGRLCDHPCTAECNRSEMDDSLLIRCIERFIGDWGLRNVKTQPAAIDPAKGEIAVIGSGPAGLSAAWQLANLGYAVTMFEASSKTGGALRDYIPEFRLPRKTLESEIHSLVDRGITMRLGVRLGHDLNLDDLQQFRAILLATGARDQRELAIPGADLGGVQMGLDFLADVNAGRRDRLKGTVAILGGGNTAVLCARAALRLGGTPVIYFRRSAAELSASADQIEEAQQEGIDVSCLVMVKSISKSGSLLKLVLQKMTLGKKDTSGQRIAVSIRGAQEEQTVSRVIVALGEDPDLSFLPEQVDRESWGIATGGTHQSSVPRIFAAGDCTDNRHGIASAIGAGRSAAHSVDRYLQSKSIYEPVAEPVITRFSNLNTAYFRRIQVTERRKISDERRKNSFAEVNMGFAEADILREAARCMSCGVCNECNNCLIFCPDNAISKHDGILSVDYDHCKGCGICIHECPHDAIHLQVRRVPVWR